MEILVIWHFAPRAASAPPGTHSPPPIIHNSRVAGRSPRIVAEGDYCFIITSTEMLNLWGRAYLKRVWANLRGLSIRPPPNTRLILAYPKYAFNICIAIIYDLSIKICKNLRIIIRDVIKGWNGVTYASSWWLHDGDECLGLLTTSATIKSTYLSLLWSDYERNQMVKPGGGVWVVMVLVVVVVVFIFGWFYRLSRTHQNRNQHIAHRLFPQVQFAASDVVSIFACATSS